MAETSRFWGGTATGDASQAPYDAENEFSNAMKSISGSAGSANRSGVFMHELNDLLPTASGSVSPANIADGRAIVYGTWYENTANVSVVIPTPGAATRNDIIALRKDWALQTVRVTRIAGVEGGGVPAIIQTPGLYWDFPLAYVAITTGGVITLTDRRSFVGAEQAKPLAILGRSTNQSIASGAEDTVVFDTQVLVSPSAMYDVANPSRLIAPFPGVYKAHAYLAWEANAVGYRISRCRLNGSGYQTEDYKPLADSAATIYTQDWTWEGELIRGDYLEVRVAHLAGAPLNVLTAAPSRTPRFSLEWLRSRY